MTNEHQGLSIGSGRTLAAGAVAVASGALAFAAVTSLLRRKPISEPEDAPEKAWRRSQTEGTVVGRTVTINRPRSELYAFWHDFSKLPQFMEDVKSVTASGDGRWRWAIAGPGDTDVILETRISSDRPNEMIAWESEEGSQIRHSGHVAFRDAPGGRGTEVSVTIDYDPPGGVAGQMIAKLFQREPHIQARRELKRFKQLMEAGEVATTEPGPAAPRA